MILIPPKEAAARMRLSKSTMYERAQDGRLTPPVKVGPRLSAWPLHEIEAINAATVAGKSADDIRALVADLGRQRTAVAA